MFHFQACIESDTLHTLNSGGRRSAVEIIYIYIFALLRFPAGLDPAELSMGLARPRKKAPSLLFSARGNLPAGSMKARVPALLATRDTSSTARPLDPSYWTLQT